MEIELRQNQQMDIFSGYIGVLISFHNLNPIKLEFKLVNILFIVVLHLKSNSQ